MIEKNIIAMHGERQREMNLFEVQTVLAWWQISDQPEIKGILSHTKTISNVNVENQPKTQEALGPRNHLGTR